jgi:UDP-N-acetylmuramoyl-tripeptide--D-alanyl-D-alanine ligase
VPGDKRGDDGNMQKITCRDILEATKGKLISGEADTEVLRVSTDSRKIIDGDLFIPLKGERFDGHDYIPAALEAGARAVLTHKDIGPVHSKCVIRVDNTSTALLDLAGWYRRKFDIPFVGITGSVGKTSTKDMVAGVLSRKFRVLKTEGNFNNEIGLPLTIFNLDSSHQAAVIEMGMSGFGEISRLTAVARPDIAIITNIGVSHIEKLGSRQNILKAKMEILEGLSEKGLVVLNGDDKLLYGLKDLLNFRTVFYGIDECCDYQAYNIHTAGEQGTSFEITVGTEDYKVHVPAPGVHNVYNALAAIAVGLELGLTMNEIIDGIASFAPGNMRMNIINRGDIKIIDDTYNASPQSMEAAITVLKDISAGNRRTVAVLGDMLEMGEWAYDAHYNVGKFAASKKIDYIITVGDNGRVIAKGALESGFDANCAFSFNNNAEVNRFLKDFVKSGDVILVKGSRGMKMEEIIRQLTGGA